MKNKTKLPVWCVMMLIMIACMMISSAITVYVTNITIEHTLYALTRESETMTGKYPDWFIEWQNTVYLREHIEE